jgi:HEAT repeat protein
MADALKHQDREIGAKAATLIRENQSQWDAVLESLLEELEDSDPETRLLTARALGRLEDGRAVAHLVQALRDDDLRVRSSVAGSLARFGGKEGLDALAGAIERRDYDLVKSQYRLFIGLGFPGSEDVLIQALEMQRDKESARHMAGTFFFCENEKLENAARRWANLNAPVLISDLEVGPELTWGRRRPE